MRTKRLPGLWTLISIGIIILALLLVGQTTSFIDYEFAVSIGLQESVNDIGEVGVAVNKAFGVGDTVVYIPLLLFGIIGLWIQKEWGFYAMFGSLAITVYWPIVNVFIILFAEGTHGFNYPNFISVLIILVLITIYGLWGLWYLYKNRKSFIQS